MHSLFAVRPSRVLTLLIPLTILMGCGEGDGQARIFNEPAAPYAGPPDSCFEVLDFEDVCGISYDFAEFEGGPGVIVPVADEPLIAGDAGNTSDKVIKAIKARAASGAVFGGFVMTVDGSPAPFTFASGTTITMRVWSQRQVNLLVEPEGGGAGSGNEVTHSGTGWEELTFTFSSFSGTTSGLVFIFDLGTNGNFGNDPDNWTFFIDNISVPEGGDGGPGPSGGFPVTFDEATPPAVTEFGGAGYAIEAGPAGGDGNSLKIVRDGGEVFAGAWVAVPEVPNDQGDQTISALVYSPTAGIPMVTKVEYGDNMGTGEVEANETVAVGWQTLTWTFTNLAPGNVYNRFTILPDLGTVGSGQSYYFDNIDLAGDGGGGGGSFDSGLLTNGDFEAGVSPWIGNAANVVDDGGNSVNSADVEVAGNPFDVNLSQVVAITQGETYTLTFKARSDAPRTMIAGIGLNEAPFTNVSETVNLTATWQTFTLELTATGFGGANSRVLFDMGADTGLVLIDDVSLVVAGDGGGGGGSFDSGLLTNGDFEAGVSPWIGNAANVVDDGGNSVNSADVEVAGNPFDVNLSQVVAITQGETYTLTFKARSDAPRTMIAGIGLNEAPFTNVSETVNLTATWQTFTLELTATGFGGANSRVLFDMGADTGLVLIDDVSLVVAGDGGGGGGSFDSGLLTNGDFEAGVDPWIGNAANVVDDGGNSVNSADVEVAGNPFDVNLSQVVAITQGETYTLTFKARSDAPRTMIAGIGLNEAPFTNVSETVNLTAAWQTFTLELTATGFGGANSRVLFDMGADTGLVLIDDVSLVVAGDGGGGGGATSTDFESGSATFADFEGGVATVIDNPDPSGINTSSKVGQMQKFAGQPFAGSTLDLGGSVALADGDSYTMKVRASREVVVTLKLEPQGDEITATHSGSGVWEELCFDFTGVSGDITGLTLIFDNGTVGDAENDPDNWTFQFDDIEQTSGACPTGGGGTAGPAALPVDFQGDLNSYDFGPEGGFEGGAASVVTNPDQSGINTSTQVGQMLKYDGAVFGGATLVIEDTSVTAGSSFTMKVWSQRTVPVLLQPEPQGPGSGVEVTHGGTGWEELTFSLPGLSGTVSGLTIIFDNGTAGAAATDPTNWTFYFDDITLVPPDTGGGGGDDTVLVTFDEATPPEVNEFGGAVATIEAGPAGGDGNALKVLRDGGEIWAGGWFTISGIPNDAGTQTVSALVYSPTPGIPMVAKLEYAENMGTGEVSANETVVAGWQTLSWTFTNLAPPNDYNRFVVLPNLGTVDTATSYYFDNITLLGGGDGGGDGGGSFDSGLLTNGDFEAGVSPWIGNAANVVDDGGNFVNSANIEVAGNPFDVNLSQVVAITQGETYTLTFKARSDGARTMIAGIGLNEAPFTNVSQTVSLTAEWQTFELQLTATSFGNANSRVLFDMGADTGLVLIDDVSLVVAGGGGGNGGSFDSGLLTNGDFEAGVSPWIGNAANVVDDGGNFVNSANIEVAGNPFDVNLSQVVAITQGETYTLTFKARSDGARTMIAGIGLNEAPFTNVSQTVSLTAEWQTFELQLTATSFGNANSRVLFDMGADTGLVLIDDVSLVVAGGGGGNGGSFDSGLLTNGDFEAGVSPWIGNAANVVDDGGNFVNSANIEVAGNPFDVNLSQVVAITQGETYTLTFKARSDGARTMIAGIGLNEAPFTNVSQTVSLTAEWQTFELQLTATSFGNANSRVLFDMGADTGLVLIDDVALVVTGGDGGGGTGDLVVDGGFEAAGTSGLQPPWFVFENGGTVSVSSSNNNGGVYSARLQADASAGTSFPILKIERVGAGSVTGGESVTVSFDVIDVDTAGVGKTFVAELFTEMADPPGGATNEVLLGGYDLTTSWQTRVFDTSLGPDAAGGVSLLFKADCGGNTSCTMDVFIDNVSIVIN